MRIDRIDIDIPGWPSLSGSFGFPSEGVALWVGPNESGKSMLPSLLVAALYGVSDSEEEVPPSGWLTVRLTLDSGEELRVARDLGTGTLQVTDPAGADLTDRWSHASSLGESLLGFTREQFRAVTHVGLDDLTTTVGHPDLRTLLATGRGADGTPTPIAPEPDLPRARETEPAAEDDDLPIFGTALEETEWGTSEPFSPGDRVLTLDGTAPPGPAPHATNGLDETPAEVDPVATLREWKRELDRAEEDLAAKSAEYRRFREQLAELHAERDRLGALDGAEPEDVERLEDLVRAFKRVGERREQIRVQEARFREDLATSALSAESLEAKDRMFGGLSEEDRRFIDGHRQTETVLRGNQALTRSESRLDESRIQEIDRARRDAARMAIGPLVLAALGLFGSIAVPLLPQIPIPPWVLLAVGLLGFLAGSTLLWRAKRLRTRELRGIRDALARKREQLTQFDREATTASGRLARLAESFGLEGGSALIAEYGDWRSHAGELRQLAQFRKRLQDIEAETDALRTHLASFTLSVTDDLGEMSGAQLDAILDDYGRHFTLRDEIATAETQAVEFESLLADGESVVAEKREQIVTMLEEADVRADGDLTEAIETYALWAARLARSPETEQDAASGWREIDPEALDVTGPGPPSSGSSPPSVPAERTPALSARMEAILRRWIPGSRAVEIDSDLVPHLKLDPAGPVISAPKLGGCGSATRDHVCLALRLAIVETLSAAGERVPVFLDDPFVRCDDARHDVALCFLAEDASRRGQVVYLTSQEVRIRWFRHQHPELAARLVPLRPGAEPPPTSEPDDSIEASSAPGSSSPPPFSSS